MRELVAVIEDSMIAPSPDDLEQVAKGVRSQRMNYAEDTGSANTLSVAFDPPVITYSIGFPIRVKIKITNTGPATIDAGAGRVSIRKPTGAETLAGDLPAGGLAELVYDGTNFQMINFGGAGGGLGDVYMVNIPYCVDSSPTPNTIIANFSPAITAIQAGTIVMVKAANTNTGPTYININGLGLKPVFAQGGLPQMPFLPGDILVGDILILTYDGTHFWITPNPIINAASTFNVTTNNEFQIVISALARKRINPYIQVTIKMATGIYGGIQVYHVDADRLIVEGTMLAANPTFADFYKTGSTPAARAQDSANNIAMLRSRYGTEVRFDNNLRGAAISNMGPGQPIIKNLLVTGANVSAGVAAANLVGMAGSLYIMGCSVWGSGGAGIQAGTMTVLDGVVVCACQSGISSVAGNMGIRNSAVYGCAVHGLISGRNGNIDVGYWAGVPGLVDLLPCQFMYNGSVGAFAWSNSKIVLDHAIVTGNADTDLIATQMSSVFCMSAVAATSSPAFNVQGNQYSMVFAS